MRRWITCGNTLVLQSLQVATDGGCGPSSSESSCSCWGFPSWPCLRCRSFPKSLQRKRKVGTFRISIFLRRANSNVFLMFAGEGINVSFVLCVTKRIQPRCQTLGCRPGHHLGSFVGRRFDQKFIRSARHDAGSPRHDHGKGPLLLPADVKQ